jgi:hypothetical protein
MTATVTLVAALGFGIGCGAPWDDDEAAPRVAAALTAAGSAAVETRVTTRSPTTPTSKGGDDLNHFADSASAQAPVIETFVAFFGYVTTAYDFYNKYVTNQPSDLAQLQTLIAQTKTQITSELDGLAAAWDSSCAANAVDTFQNIDTLTLDNLQAFAISSDKCVTDAEAQIGAVTTKDAIDKIGFALNTVGPIALLTNAHAGFPTDALKQHIVQANQQLRTRLAPICDVSIDDPAGLPTFSGSVNGHGACYNYTVPTPPRLEVGELGGVFYLAPGPGKAFLSWPLLGYATPDDDVLWWRGHTAYFPRVDFSIAINEVMQGTSWQIAGAVLDRLLPSAGPFGSPVALTVATDTIYTPMDAFVMDGTDNPFNGALNPYPDGANPSFSGWRPIDGALQSVAAGANADGRVEMFGLSRIGGIFHRWQRVAGDDSQWSPWAEMDGELNSIAVAHNYDGTLQVFGTNSAQGIYTRNQVLGGDQYTPEPPVHPVPGTDTWTSWKQMDGFLSQVAAVTGRDGIIQLFGINSDGMLYHRQQVARNATDPSVTGTWTAWDQIQVPAPLRTLAAAIDLGGRVNIFGTLDDDRIFQRVNSGDVTTGWFQIPGSLHSIAAVKEGGGQAKLVLIGVNAQGDMYLNTSDGLIDFTPIGPMPGAWNGWVSLPRPRVRPAGPIDPIQIVAR